MLASQSGLMTFTAAQFSSQSPRLLLCKSETIPGHTHSPDNIASSPLGLSSQCPQRGLPWPNYFTPQLSAHPLPPLWTCFLSTVLISHNIQSSHEGVICLACCRKGWTVPSLIVADAWILQSLTVSATQQMLRV